MTKSESMACRRQSASPERSAGPTAARRVLQWAILCAVIGTGIAAMLAGPRYVHGLSLVIRAADLTGVWRRAADLDTVLVDERFADSPVGTPPIRVRVYEPRGSRRHTVLLVSGLHPAGIDEPRLVSLARKLSETGVTVVTPDVPELRQFAITPGVTDRIEQLARWLAADSGVVASRRIGLMGVSFSGGLSIVAAGRPSLRDRLLYVFSFGGHDDLGRVLDFLCRGGEGGRPPHDYGLAIVLLNLAERVVPPAQVDPLREMVRRFLWASHLDTFDKDAAQRAFAALRDDARRLPEPSATLMGYANDRDVIRLGPRLLPHVASYRAAAALSPSQSPAPTVPVFLLHGRGDTVIPADESQRLAGRLGPHVPVRLLLTDLVSHAAADQPAYALDVVRLAGFWGAVLDH